MVQNSALSQGPHSLLRPNLVTRRKELLVECPVRFTGQRFEYCLRLRIGHHCDYPSGRRAVAQTNWRIKRFRGSNSLTEGQKPDVLRDQPIEATIKSLKS